MNPREVLTPDEYLSLWHIGLTHEQIAEVARLIDNRPSRPAKTERPGSARGDA